MKRNKYLMTTEYVPILKDFELFEIYIQDGRSIASVCKGG